MQTPFNKAYHNHKNSAQKRGIVFLLTFREWLKIWGVKIKLKGRHRTDYCMARFNDKGAYAIGNVKIVMNCQNRAEQKVKRSTRLKMRLAKLGNKLSLQHRQNIGLGHLGKKHTVKSLQKQRRIKLGEKNPMAKLTRKNVLMIRDSKLVSKELGIKLGVSSSLVSMVRRGARWGHVK